MLFLFAVQSLCFFFILQCTCNLLCCLWATSSFVYQLIIKAQVSYYLSIERNDSKAASQQQSEIKNKHEMKVRKYPAHNAFIEVIYLSLTDTTHHAEEDLSDEGHFFTFNS